MGWMYIPSSTAVLLLKIAHLGHYKTCHRLKGEFFSLPSNSSQKKTSRQLSTEILPYPKYPRQEANCPKAKTLYGTIWRWLFF